MKNIGKITRIAIFIDYDNFTISYAKKWKVKRENIAIWDGLCNLFVKYYQDTFIRNSFEVVDHVGTYLCVGLSERYYVQEEKKRRHFKALDRKNGFIIKYGGRSGAYVDPNTKAFNPGTEKGVDAEIICQMLMGAFLDHFDACILLSDDADYLPAVNRVQDYFAKKVIQAGFQKCKLREHCYGNIPLEQANRRLVIPRAKKKLSK